MTRGFTLIELCITLAIFSILLLCAIPSWQHLMRSQQNQSQRDTLFLAIQTARYESIRRREVLVLCPDENTSRCGKAWSKGQILFADRNHNHQVDKDEPILYFFKGMDRENHLRWVGFLNDNHIQFFPGGYNDNGKFLYEDAISGRSIQFILNRVGRVHLEE